MIGNMLVTVSLNVLRNLYLNWHLHMLCCCHRSHNLALLAWSSNYVDFMFMSCSISLMSTLEEDRCSLPSSFPQRCPPRHW